jgi:hypothetical protein
MTTRAQSSPGRNATWTEPDHEHVHTIRSGWTLDGQRIFLEHDAEQRLFRVASRWAWLLKFAAIEDACDAFDALELMEGSISDLARHLAAEIRRAPRYRIAKTAPAMARVVDLVRCVELRMRGLRPQACGRKHAVVQWINS